MEVFSLKEKILVAVDFSEVTEPTVKYACKLAKDRDVEVTFLHVVPEPSLLMYNYAAGIPQFLADHQIELISIAEKKIDFYIDKLVEKSECSSDVCERLHKVVVDGEAARTITEYAKEHKFTLILLGYKGHSAMERLLIGSTLTKVVPNAPCSVMIYRPPVE